MKLRTKFFVIFTLLSIIPAVTIFATLFLHYLKHTEQQTAEVYQHIYDSAIDEANQSISEINHVLESMSFYTDGENSIIRDLKKYTKTGNYTSMDIYNSNNHLKFLIQSLIYSSDNLNGIFIFTPSGQTLGYGNNIDVKPRYLPFTSTWYTRTLELEGKTYINGITTKDFLIHAKPSISFSKALYDVYTHEFLGVLFVDCKPEIFDLSIVSTLPDKVLLTIKTDHNFILYSNVDSLSQNTAESASLMQPQSAELDMYNLTLTSAVNPRQLYHEFDIMKTLFSILCGLYILLFFIISFLLSRYLTNPIIHLSKQMANHKLNSYVTKEKYLNRSDEIGILFNEYNSMLDEQQRYIKNEYQNKLITLDSQMKSLEAQINSHFLYNTLESINSLAEIEGIESISTMSMALGNMFRYSIKAKSELVPVSEEIANVQDYVSIQSIRFSNKFQLKLQIPEEMYHCRVLKLIFQPLVENALLHGLDRCATGDTITITGSFQDNNLLFLIQDNGIGIEPSQVKKIESILAEPPHFKELGRRSTQSIGLKNVSSRIELYYGAGYGLSLSSEIGRGTTISIKLPYIHQEE